MTGRGPALVLAASYCLSRGAGTFYLPGCHVEHGGRLEPWTGFTERETLVILLNDAKREKQGQLENKALCHVSPPDRAGINKSASHEGRENGKFYLSFL